MSITCTEQEGRCVIHWFQTWSPYQKEEFLKDLVEKAVPHKVTTLFDAMESLNVADKPPSIYKCQMKLFSQWFDNWTDKERNAFLQELETIDAAFVRRFESELAATCGKP